MSTRRGFLGALLAAAAAPAIVKASSLMPVRAVADVLAPADRWMQYVGVGLAAGSDLMTFSAWEKLDDGWKMVSTTFRSRESGVIQLPDGQSIVSSVGPNDALTLDFHNPRDARGIDVRELQLVQLEHHS